MPSTNQTGIDVEVCAEDIKEQGYAECVVCDKKIHGDALEEISTSYASHIMVKHKSEVSSFPIPLIPSL